MTATFSQLSVLGSSLILLFAFIILGRREVPAYVNAFAWQSTVLAGELYIASKEHRLEVPRVFAAALICAGDYLCGFRG